MGRIDDVINVAGHRLGTAEIESALVSHEAVAESAVVARPDDLKGSAIIAFVTLEGGRARFSFYIWSGNLDYLEGGGDRVILLKEDFSHWDAIVRPLK